VHLSPKDKGRERVLDLSVMLCDQNAVFSQSIDDGISVIPSSSLNMQAKLNL
jgi:hypothetical protein